MSRHTYNWLIIFYSVLQKILSNSSIDIRLHRKSVFLLADLVECQLQSRNDVEVPFFSNHILLKSVVDLMASADVDLQEKVKVLPFYQLRPNYLNASIMCTEFICLFWPFSQMYFLLQILQALYAVKSLLMLRSADALVLRDICELDLALGRMKQQLQQMIVDDKFKEYALDMENLRKEAELIFLGKLEKVRCISVKVLSSYKNLT